VDEVDETSSIWRVEAYSCVRYSTGLRQLLRRQWKRGQTQADANTQSEVLSLVASVTVVTVSRNQAIDCSMLRSYHPDLRPEIYSIKVCLS
jgi:hypothetical protein